MSHDQRAVSPMHPQSAQTVSIPCTCGEKIIFSLHALLQFKGGTCWNCGATLTLSPAENRASRWRRPPSGNQGFMPH